MLATCCAPLACVLLRSDWAKWGGALLYRFSGLAKQCSGSRRCLPRYLPRHNLKPLAPPQSFLFMYLQSMYCAGVRSRLLYTLVPYYPAIHVTSSEYKSYVCCEQASKSVRDGQL